MKDSTFAKFVLLINGLVPLAVMSYDGIHHRLGPNPVEYWLHTCGLLALFFLTLTLAITPARKISGFNYLSHFRRSLGLFAFFYASLHFLIYFIFDESGSVRAVIADIVKRNFILLGATALLFMAPLAVTSTKGMIKRLGAAQWKQLHQLVYVCAIAGVIHFWLARKHPKLDATQKIYGWVIGSLLLYRLIDKFVLPYARSRPSRA